MNEVDKRAEVIDPKLLVAGWETDSSKGVRVRREYKINDGEIRAGGIRTNLILNTARASAKAMAEKATE